MANSDRRINIIGTIGEGGFGQVYLADVHGSNGFSQRVALKVLRASARDQPQLVARLRDEARLLGQLSHPNIVRVHDLDELEGHPAVIMEYVAGLDLHSLVVQGGPLPLKAAVQVCEGVAAALVAAWQAESPFTGRPLRALHRDIKPHNILVTVHGQAKVLDFGIARAEFDREGHTQDERFGTPAFQPPELYLHDVTGPPHDIFALGLTLARMVAPVAHGRWPAGPDAFAREHKEWRRQLDAALGPERPQQRVLNMIVGMTRYDPARRPNAARVLEWARELWPGLPGADLVMVARQRVQPAVKARHQALSAALAQADTAQSPPPVPTPVELSTMEPAEARPGAKPPTPSASPLSPQPAPPQPAPPQPAAQAAQRSALRGRLVPVAVGAVVALALLTAAVATTGLGVALYQRWDESRSRAAGQHAEPPQRASASTAGQPPSTVPRESSGDRPAEDPAVDTEPPAISQGTAPAAAPTPAPHSPSAAAAKPATAAPTANPRAAPSVTTEPTAGAPPTVAEPDDASAALATSARALFVCSVGGQVTIGKLGTYSMPTTQDLPTGTATAVSMRIEQQGEVYRAKKWVVPTEPMPVTYRCEPTDDGFEILGGR